MTNTGTGTGGEMGTGFFGVVPRTFDHGGSHYGELKAFVPVFNRGALQFGPAAERVVISGVRDYTKFGVAGKLNPGALRFNWEVFPYATRKNPGSVSSFYVVPLFGGWRIDGF